METRIVALGEHFTDAHLEALARILSDSVAEGAAVGFMSPLLHEEALQFWKRDIRNEVLAERRVLFAALRGDSLVGTVQLVTAMPPNQPHRCEIAKMIVDPRARRLGIGRSLMNHALDHARRLGKTLITLDTRTGDVAEPLYASVGFEVAGIIPDFAWDADGRARHATTYMFRRL